MQSPKVPYTSPVQDTSINFNWLNYGNETSTNKFGGSHRSSAEQQYFPRAGDRFLHRSLLPLSPDVRMELENRKLWHKFHDETNEMIITKTGRRMFPPIQLAVSGLEKQQYYYVLLELTPASNRRYKYCGNGGAGDDEGRNRSGDMGGWSIAGPAEPQSCLERRLYFHPNGPATGEHWMQNSILFNKLKLTNNAVDYRTNLVLTSMHKYIPKIWIIRCPKAKSLHELFSHPTSSFTFEETAFIAVTAYQNENITKLKIDNNPFAKGFRESGQSRCKRKYSLSDRDHSNDRERNSPSESESNRSASSLDNLMQESRPEIGSLDSDDGSSSAKKLRLTAANRESPTRAGNDHDETQTIFHRPWLKDSPSPNRPIIMAQSSPMLPPSMSPDEYWIANCWFMQRFSPYVTCLPNYYCY